MEFEKLPGAYSLAVDLSDRAAAGDGAWRSFAQVVRASKRSFEKVSDGAASDAEFQAYQRDAASLDSACAELGIRLLEN
ncbi:MULTISPECIES: hypothetical protein [unclassified Leifsonia]|uniref:hypothetical protein n=1 Tax=unclassified Leifsonia TaxID=2663824 RepID=UPI0003719D4A|nr:MULTISPECIES: hypothetical protein [unclassified Leifsonia]TDQ02856.1 hypothetical protein AXZ95_1136 [Leifsonia sp. 115AMFTsu3.1]